jgi:6-phosphogluconate dehydrogenase
MKQQDIGLIGLAVMGQNLALNMERNGFGVAVYNRTASTTKAFLDGPAAGKKIAAAYRSSQELLASLKKPRTIMTMVQAGPPVDAVLAQLKAPSGARGSGDGRGQLPLPSTHRSPLQGVGSSGVSPFLGVGVFIGGEEGALWGPEHHAGGPREAYARIQPLLEAIAAKVRGEPCVTWIGPRGSGHFVKMVHNAIEVRGHAAHRRGLRPPPSRPGPHRRRSSMKSSPGGTRGSYRPISSR